MQVAAPPSEVTWTGVPLSLLTPPRPGKVQTARGPSNPRTVWPGNREAGSALGRPPGPCGKYRADGRPARQLLGALAGPSVPWTAIASSFQPLLTLHVSGPVPGAGRRMASEARCRPGTAGLPRPRPGLALRGLPDPNQTAPAPAPLTLEAGRPLAMGSSCALKDLWQHPWLPPTSMPIAPPS